MIKAPLPFFDERRAEIELAVLHATAFNAEETWRLFKDRHVSCHYFIAADGEVYQAVAEEKRAWHAGKGCWREYADDINSRSVGIELENVSLGQSSFGEAQKETLKRLLADVAGRYNLRQVNIVGHSDIAPGRKADPGKAFFWKELAEAGFGLWPDEGDAFRIQENDPQRLLAAIGYDTTDLRAAAYAFCRRYLPEKVVQINDVWELDRCPGKADTALIRDEKFITVLKATAYKYLRESKTPCRI